MNHFTTSRTFLFVSLVVAAGAFAAAPGCTPSGCPDGSMRSGDQCVPLDCGPEDASFFADADGDGHGDPETSSCTPVAGYVSLGGDCDDQSTSVNPDAADLCNGIDENCDGVADETFACAGGQPNPCETSCGSTGTRGCSASCEPVGECVPPAEQCNGIDDDCDGAVDEGSRVLAEAGPIGSAGDAAIGIVPSPSGYVAFLLRGDQVLAQPLRPTGEIDGAEVPMFEGTPPELSLVRVAANDSTAYVLYVASNTVRVAAFDLATSTFGGSADLFAAAHGFASASLAASNERVVALLMQQANEKNLVVVGTVSIDVNLMSASDLAPLYEGSPLVAFGGTASLALARPGAPGSPWVGTYYRVAAGDLPSAKMLVGFSATGDVSVPAQALDAQPGAFGALATEDVLGLFASTRAGSVELHPFHASTLAPSADEPVANDTSVASAPLSVDRVLGQWAVAYVREVGGEAQVTLALFDDLLARTDLVPSLTAPDVTGLDGAARDDGLALLVGVAGARPEVLAYGCTP